MGEEGLPLPIGERGSYSASGGSLPLSPTLSPKREGESVRLALARATARIASATPRLDAELLMAHALGISREALILSHLDAPAPAAFAALVERRLHHEPVAYITGTRSFWTIDLQVAPGVLIPRADSETLIEAAVAHFGRRSPARILDLGTGPGTLLLAALDHWPRATGIGIDRSATALGQAAVNAERLGLVSRARFQSGDWGEGVEERFDLVLANPPYITSNDPLPPEVSDFEPPEALYAGADGLNAYRVLVPQLARLLASGGAAAMEIGAMQADAVAALVCAQGLRTEVKKDLGGRERCLLVTP